MILLSKNIKKLFIKNMNKYNNYIYYFIRIINKTEQIMIMIYNYIICLWI